MIRKSNLSSHKKLLCNNKNQNLQWKRLPETLFYCTIFHLGIADAPMVMITGSRLIDITHQHIFILISQVDET